MWIIKNMKSKVTRPDFWGAVSICSTITRWIIRNGLLLGASSVIVTTAAVVTTNCVTTAIDTIIRFTGSRQPHVKLSQPVLQSVDWHNTQNGPSIGVAQEHITKWDHLENKTILNSNCFQFIQNHRSSLISRFSQWLFTNDGQVDICMSPNAGPEKGHSSNFQFPFAPAYALSALPLSITMTGHIPSSLPL